jgi:hypothetical protein
MNLVPQNGSKDHLDLLILTGDLQAATGEEESAENTYTLALQVGDFVKGGSAQVRLFRIMIAQRRCGLSYMSSRTALDRAGEVSLLKLAGRKPMLDEIANEESFVVRVTAFSLYQERYPAPQAIARRKQPSKQQVIQLVKDARQQAAIRYPHR